MKIGKLPNSLLNKLIIEPVNTQSPPIEEVLAGPSVGEDCALLDFGGDDILVSSDPITATEENAGRLLVTVCANDISASGGKPIGLMVTALLPPHTTEDDIKTLMSDLLDEAKKHNIAILGGHTEITDAVNRIVLSGTILGKIKKGAHLKTSGASLGDEIVMTKSAGLEGTAILANSFNDLLSNELGADLLQSAKRYQESTSVTKDAEIVYSFGVSGMHDITEGGVLGACAEASEASGLGFSIDLRKVPVSDVTKKICEFLGISPYELVSSGSLLITVKDGDGLVDVLKKSGSDAAVIGEVTATSSSVTDLDGKINTLIPPQADAVYTAISRAKNYQSGDDDKNCKPLNIVFVCTGNTCRSPMAEGIAKRLAESGNPAKVKKYRFISRGICADDFCVSQNSLLAMQKKGIDISDIKPSLLTKEDVEAAYIILTMTNAHKRFILERFSDITNISEKTVPLREYACEVSGDIIDPFGYDLSVYLKCADELEMCVAEVIKRLNIL